MQKVIMILLYAVFIWWGGFMAKSNYKYFKWKYGSEKSVVAWDVIMWLGYMAFWAVKLVRVVIV